MRVTVALACLSGAVLSLLLISDATIPNCLGPLGATLISCVKRTGVFPNPGVGLGHGLAFVFALAAVAAAPATSRLRGRSLALAVLSAPVAAGLYALLRPRSLEGPDVSIMRTGANGQDAFEPGPWRVLPWPFDPASAAGFAILAATAVLLATAAFALIRGRRIRMSTAS